MGRIITFGEIMLRLSPNGYQRLFQDNKLQATFGGAEANVAVSLATFGENTAFVTKVPDQKIGDGAIKSLLGAGVDVAGIVRGGDRLGIYFLEKGASIRSSLCIYDRAGSAIQQANPADFDWAAIFEGADWFHYTGITPALGGNLPEIIKEACHVAKLMGLMVSCDLNYRSKLWSRKEAQKTMTDLCKYIDVCIGNEEDARNVFGIETYNTDIENGVLDRNAYELTAKELKDRFDFEVVAFSLRSSHSATSNDWAGMVYDGTKFYHSKQYHLDYIVDRVGSGDSYAAGLIYGIHQGWDLQKTLDFAVAASALKHTVEGDFNRVSFEEVLKLIQGSGSGRIER